VGVVKTIVRIGAFVVGALIWIQALVELPGWLGEVGDDLGGDAVVRLILGLLGLAVVLLAIGPERLGRWRDALWTDGRAEEREPQTGPEPTPRSTGIDAEAGEAGGKAVVSNNVVEGFERGISASGFDDLKAEGNIARREARTNCRWIADRVRHELRDNQSLLEDARRAGTFRKFERLVGVWGKQQRAFHGCVSSESYDAVREAYRQLAILEGRVGRSPHQAEMPSVSVEGTDEELLAEVDGVLSAISDALAALPRVD
jgi:hypothetical protein